MWRYVSIYVTCVTCNGMSWFVLYWKDMSSDDISSIVHKLMSCLCNYHLKDENRTDNSHLTFNIFFCWIEFVMNPFFKDCDVLPCNKDIHPGWRGAKEHGQITAAMTINHTLFNCKKLGKEIMGGLVGKLCLHYGWGLAFVCLCNMFVLVISHQKASSVQVLQE